MGRTQCTPALPRTGRKLRSPLDTALWPHRHNLRWRRRRDTENRKGAAFFTTCESSAQEAHLAQVDEEGRRGERRRGEQEKQRLVAHFPNGTRVRLTLCGSEVGSLTLARSHLAKPNVFWVCYGRMVKKKGLPRREAPRLLCTIKSTQATGQVWPTEDLSADCQPHSDWLLSRKHLHAFANVLCIRCRPKYCLRPICGYAKRILIHQEARMPCTAESG